MKAMLFLFIAPTVFLFQQEPVLVTESYKLVNDLNAAENRAAVYMCSEVNNIWQDYLSPKSVEDEFDRKKADTLSKYIGGDLATWKRNIPFIESWEPRVKATEFVSYRGLDIDDFYKKHNRNGVFLYSAPLFSQDRTKAIIYIWYLTARQVTLDNYYYCEKENGSWKKKSVVLIGGF